MYHWADNAPERIFLAERNRAGEWESFSYSKALDLVERIAQSLLDRGMNADTPLLILSGNSVRHALLTLGAMHVGVPVVPVSPAYSLMSQTYDKLRSIASQIKPHMIYAEDSSSFAGAIEVLRSDKVEVVCAQGGKATPFDSLWDTTVSSTVRAHFDATGPDTVAKILFTSGSTGAPKGVINTQRMLCSNQKSLQQIWPFLADVPPVVVDWLPWHHTFGGNHNFNMILSNGGSLYIDEGKPRPGAMEPSIVMSPSPSVCGAVASGCTLNAPPS